MIWVERMKQPHQPHEIVKLWVFAYGSLMWRPGFNYVEAHRARLDGLHRSLCIYSIHHRGTKQQPGLVLGLDRGGECFGRAFGIAQDKEVEVRAYLKEREQITNVYREAIRPVELLTGTKRVVEALCFVIDPAHEQYAGKLALERQVAIVKNANGASGNNQDYVAKTLQHLREADIFDHELEVLMARLS